MSSKKAKKKRPSNLFDFDNVKAEMEEKNKCFAEVRGHLEALRNTDVKSMFSAMTASTISPRLQEEEVLQLLACKISIRNLYNIKAAIQHVPDKIPRVVDGISLRLLYIFKVFKALSDGNGGVQLNLSIADMGIYVKFLETYCPTFLSKQDQSEDLWKLTEKENMFFNKFLTPPVKTCLRCQKLLTMRNYPVNVKLFTIDGPVPCSKITLECRGCSCVYGVCNFSDESGNHFYPADIDESNIRMVEVSNVTYIDLKLYKWFPSLSNHCWVSFSGFAEAYNDVLELGINKYGSLLNSSQIKTEEERLTEIVTEASEEANTKGNIGILPGELSPKAIAQCFWQREVEEELASLGLREKWTFSKVAGPLSGSYDQAMEFVDKIRCDKLYTHTCSDHCRNKGCGALYVADGNWKLRYAHCMWRVPVVIPGFGDVNYPNVCPMSPKRGHAFCEKHCTKASQLGYPSELREFYKHCGVNKTDIGAALDEMSSDSQVSGTVYEKIDSCLDKFAKLNESGDDISAASFQGTADFIFANPAFVNDASQVGNVVCNKDTGGLKALHCWSRGVFFIVSAGGHIEYWQPLYRSESPTQAFLVTVLWLYRKFKSMKEGQSDDAIRRAISSICLAYDNMCHMDSLRISKLHLPLPKPFNEAWQLISKVTDRLHLRNHVDPKCKDLYDPDKHLSPTFNTMACEQTFIWASRFKKIICAMPHVHQFFFLHRLVQYRNKYTEKCHQMRKTPVLPKVGKHCQQ